MAGFSVNIGADTAQFTKNLAELQRQLKAFQEGLKTATGADSVARLNRAIAETKSRMEALKGFQGVAGLKDIAPGANQAANALGNLSRVAQDAPFGFIGIQNNLNPLLESFQRLKVETGSTGGALKALGGSLLGVGGIGFALSTISSLITVSILKYGSLGNAVKELFGTLSNLEKANTALNKAQNEANKTAGDEIARMQVLAAVASDITRSTEKRGQATDELQKILKANNVELSREAILNGQSAEAIEKATDAILKRARARAVEARLSELQTQRLDLEIKESNAITNLTNKQAEFNKELKAGRLNERSRGFFLRTAVDEIDEVKKGLKDVDEQIAFTLAKVNIDKVDPVDPKKLKEGEDLLKKQLDFIEKIRDAQKEFTGKLFDVKDIDEATNKLASLEQQVGNLKLQIAVRDAQKAGLPAGEIEKLKDAIKQDTQKRLNEAFEKEALLLEFSTKLKFSQVNRAEFPSDIDSAIAKATGFDKKIPLITLHEARVKILGAKLTEKIEFQEKIARELNTAINDAIKGLKIDSITSVAEAIGESLTGGDIQNVFKSLFTVIANGLQQFGKALIAYGLAQKAFQVATKSLNPTIAIAAGAGLIIAGAVLKASLPKFATGGIVNGPIVGQIGEMHRPEVIMPLDRLPQMLRSIGGGGGNDMQFIPIINNEGLYLAVKRGERRVGRKY
jgi:hypothetical protein